MRPAFSSTKSAAAFALMLLVLLLLPALFRKNWLPSREEAYAAQSWGTGPYPWIQQQIFEEKGDIDIAFIGSSHILHCFDARRIQDQLSKNLGRPATVRVLGWGGAGYDAVYFIARDLLAHRKVHLLVFYDEPDGRNSQSPTWFRFCDSEGDLRGLPWREKGLYYFAALVGMPRNLLALIRPNLPADLHTAQPNYWEDHYRSANIADGLGATSSELGFANGDVDATVPFIPFTPETGVTSSEVSVYSPTTKTNFQFAAQPLQGWQVHFVERFARLAEKQGCKLVAVHIPIVSEARTPFIEERAFWPETLGMPVDMVGLPPAKMFANLTDDQIRQLYFNPTHMNQNGQKYFTSLIMPALLEIYGSSNHH